MIVGIYETLLNRPETEEVRSRYKVISETPIEHTTFVSIVKAETPWVSATFAVDRQGQWWALVPMPIQGCKELAQRQVSADIIDKLVAGETIWFPEKMSIVDFVAWMSDDEILVSHFKSGGNPSSDHLALQPHHPKWLERWVVRITP